MGYSGRFDVFGHGNQDPDGVPSESFYRTRLGVLRDDFGRFGLIALPAKKTDTRTAGFLRRYGHACAELDALPPTELRRQVGGREASAEAVPGPARRDAS